MAEGGSMTLAFALGVPALLMILVVLGLGRVAARADSIGEHEYLRLTLRGWARRVAERRRRGDRRALSLPVLHERRLSVRRLVQRRSDPTVSDVTAPPVHAVPARPAAGDSAAPGDHPTPAAA